jgi:hypothetical protein
MIEPSDQNAADGAAVLDNSCRYPQVVRGWFINVACSRASAAETLSHYPQKSLGDCE